VTDDFEIIIKDSFFEEKIFIKLKQIIDKKVYSPSLAILRNENNHPWFSAHPDKEIPDMVKEKCEKILNKKLEINFCVYSLVATVEALPHRDISPKCDYQTIIYIKGNTNLHKGTGFYTLSETTKDHELNTHVGFKENRAIIWRSNAVHSPLNWASKEPSKRYSIICQFKEMSKM
jgi:hypothetical protein